jgi:AraC-like DNA-binding protein
MKYTIIPPPAALRNYVQYFWTIQTEALPARQFSIRTFVDDSSGIIFQHLQGKSAIQKDGQLIPGSFFYGQSTMPTLNEASSGFTAVGALFFPYALFELFGTEAHHLTNQLIPVGEFMPCDIEDAVRNTQDSHEHIRLMANFLTRQVKKAGKEDALIKHCIGHISARKGLLTVDELRKYYSISERQLERRFNAVVGVSPRHYIKLTRLQEAITMLKTGKSKILSDIAYALNYADQSHFIRHIKELTGLNPGQLQQQLSTAPVNLIL